MAAINSLKAFARASKDEVESDVSRSDLYMINPTRIREEEGFNPVELSAKGITTSGRK